MKLARSVAVALVTTPNLRVARRVARAALEANLAACANLIPGVESHYWWQGKLERGTEVLILFKTTRARLGALEQCVLDHHPYDTPEFVVLDVAKGNRRYLDWVAACVNKPAIC